MLCDAVNCTINNTNKGYIKRKLPQLISISDLRQDSAKVLKLIQDSTEPLIITQRGRAAAVMLSLEMYERAERDKEILRLMIAGEKETAAGQGYDLDAVLKAADALLLE